VCYLLIVVFCSNVLCAHHVFIVLTNNSFVVSKCSVADLMKFHITAEAVCYIIVYSVNISVRVTLQYFVTCDIKSSLLMTTGVQVASDFDILCIVTYYCYVFLTTNISFIYSLLRSREFSLKL